MSYIKATEVLPEELLNLIQNYVDGEYLYIPRKKCNKKVWGEITKSKKEVHDRNTDIYKRFNDGVSIKDLSEKFFLSPKSIQRIILIMKKEN